MGDKSNKKISEKKLHKYDHIDNNYLTFDKDTANTMIICGLATAMSCLFFAIEPFGVIFYIMAILEKTQAYINQTVFILIMCGIATVGSLAASIFAKIKYQKSKWAVVNIVYISIVLVITVLISWFFIWLVNTYGTA